MTRKQSDKLDHVPRGFERMSMMFKRLNDEQPDQCSSMGYTLYYDVYELDCEDNFLRLYDCRNGDCIAAFNADSIYSIIFVVQQSYKDLYYAEELIPVETNCGDNLDLVIIFKDNSFFVVRGH